MKNENTNVKNDIEQCQLDDILSNLMWNPPFGTQLIHLCSGTVCILIQRRMVKWNHILEPFLLDRGLERLLVCSNMLVVATILLTRRRWLSVRLLLMWLAIALLWIFLLGRVLSWLSLFQQKIVSDYYCPIILIFLFPRRTNIAIATALWVLWVSRVLL